MIEYLIIKKHMISVDLTFIQYVCMIGGGTTIRIE